MPLVSRPMEVWMSMSVRCLFYSEAFIVGVWEENLRWSNSGLRQIEKYSLTVRMSLGVPTYIVERKKKSKLKKWKRERLEDREKKEREIKRDWKIEKEREIER